VERLHAEKIHNLKITNKQKKVAINDALPLKAAGVMPLPNANLFAASNVSCRQTQCR